MSLFQIITLILLTGQVSGSSLIGANQGMDGWKPNPDGSLNYILKLSPELVSEIEKGQNAKFQIPRHVLGFMSSVTIEIGDTPVPREPSEEELKRDYNSGLGSGLTTIQGSASNSDRIREIDRSTDLQVKNVNQSGVSGFGTPPVTSTNPAIGGTPSSAFQTPYSSPTSGNPALTGSMATIPPVGAPTASPLRNNEPMYPVTQPANNFGGSASAFSMTDPPSVPSTSNNTVYGTMNPNPNYATQPLNSPFGASAPAVTDNRYNENLQATRNQGFDRGADRSQWAQNYASNNGNLAPATNRYSPSEYPGSSNIPYNYGMYTTTNPGSGMIPDTRTAMQTTQPSRTEQNAISLLEDFKLENYSLQNENRKLKDEQSELRPLSMMLKAENLTPKDVQRLIAQPEEASDRVLWYQLFSIVLFVACCFLTVSMYRVYHAYRSLRASSRHAMNLNI